MGALDKSCGNCEFFKEEGADGYGWCTHQSWIAFRESACTCFEPKTNGWTEITPDNVEELYPVIDRVMVAYKLGEGLAGYSSLTELYKPLKDLALTGGYYFFILPELKIE
jgi:hypothetical protein